MPSGKQRAQRSTPTSALDMDPHTDAADALFRSAIEACRQHERVARCSGRGCSEEERREMAELCDLGHKHLAARTVAWEKAAGEGRGKSGDAFWHAANALWHASREYARRHRSCDKMTTSVSRRSTDALGALTLEYELEASSLLALRQAVADYRKVRVDAE
ncbi:MAG: hypothetical protein ACREN6_17260 [Gemmatimonadaceae bacterium]